MSGLPESDFVFVPEKELVVPRSGFIDHLHKRWWVIHPERGLAFYNPHGKRRGYGNPYGAPQCNPSEAITRRLCYPWSQVKFIESIFLPLRIEDYE